MDTLLVNTQGLLLHAIVHAADLRDRDGGVLLVVTLVSLFPFLRKLYADGGYPGPGVSDCVLAYSDASKSACS